jgi:hypothetical protein
MPRPPSPHQSTWIVISIYFLTSGVFAPYLSILPIRFRSEFGEKLRYETEARVGLKVFLADSIAVSPALEYSKQLTLDSSWKASMIGDLLSLLAEWPIFAP